MTDTWREAPEKESIKGAALIDKAFQLIDIVGAAPGHVSVQQLIKETGWARPTLYRILSAIASKGFLRFDPVVQGYTLGYRFLELAQNVWSGPDLAAIASIELRRLRDMTGETAYLAVAHDGAMVGLGKFEGTHTVRSAAKLGIRKPMHCTSQGKAFMAFMTNEQVAAYINRGEMERFTERTIVDPAQLISHLAIVRQRGYAVEDEEIILGNRCVGAPVLDHAGKPVAAISVAGPVWRLTAERVEQLGPEVATVARSISAQLRSTFGGPVPNGQQPYAHLAAGKPAFYGADPVWDKRRKLLVWTDRLGPAILEADDHITYTYRLPDDEPVQASCFSEDGAILWQGSRCLRLSSGAFIPSDMDDTEPTAATAAPGHGIWTAVYNGKSSTITRLKDTANQAWTLNAHITCLTASADGKVIYAADAGNGSIYLLRVGTNNPRIFCRIPRVSGEPRALALDDKQRLWVALYDGWSVVRLSDEGEVDHVVALPVPRPTGLAFTGSPNNNLFVTSARVGLAREVLDNAPLSGRILVVPL